MAFDSKFQAAADALPYPPEDISERPTLSDRFSLERAEQIASESLTPAAPEAFDSLPPDALESDAPSPFASPSLAPARRRQLISQPLIDEPPAVSELAETDRNWVSLESIPPAHRLSDLPPAPSTTAPFPLVSQGDLGATLPGVVVDTVVSTNPLNAEEISPSAEVEPRSPADAPVSPAGAPVHELGKYRGPSSPAAEAPLKESDLRPKRRGVAPVLFAIAVAAAVVALMVRSKPPSGDAHDAAPAIRAPEHQVTPTVAAPIAQQPNPQTPTGAQPTGARSTGVEATASVAAKPTAAEPSGEPTVAPLTAATSTSASALNGPTAVAEAPTAAQQPTAQQPTAQQPTAQQVLSPDAITDTEPPRDPNTLSSKNAWLFVHSTVSTHVFVHGVDAGLTNTWLETACGTRFVRLGNTAGDWLSPGVPTIIRCRSANTIEVPVP
jgi:hypothetical protein